jgi:hypothetical protein
MAESGAMEPAAGESVNALDLQDLIEQSMGDVNIGQKDSTPIDYLATFTPHIVSSLRYTIVFEEQRGDAEAQLRAAMPGIVQACPKEFWLELESKHKQLEWSAVLSMGLVRCRLRHALNRLGMRPTYAPFISAKLVNEALERCDTHEHSISKQVRRHLRQSTMLFQEEGDIKTMAKGLGIQLEAKATVELKLKAQLPSWNLIEKANSLIVAVSKMQVYGKDKGQELKRVIIDLLCQHPAMTPKDLEAKLGAHIDMQVSASESTRTAAQVPMPKQPWPWKSQSLFRCE